jgi:hypothetical protein
MGLLPKHIEESLEQLQELERLPGQFDELIGKLDRVVVLLEALVRLESGLYNDKYQVGTEVL